MMHISGFQHGSCRKLGKLVTKWGDRLREASGKPLQNIDDYLMFYGKFKSLLESEASISLYERRAGDVDTICRIHLAEQVLKACWGRRIKLYSLALRNCCRMVNSRRGRITW